MFETARLVRLRGGSGDDRFPLSAKARFRGMRDATFLNMRRIVFRLQLLRAGRETQTVEILPMATQIVMDNSGDSRHHFDPKDLKALAEAERRFKVLTGNGFTAATRQANGDVSLVRSFDSKAEETVFYPRLVGG
jgi:hypothetical protein